MFLHKCFTVPDSANNRAHHKDEGVEKASAWDNYQAHPGIPIFGEMNSPTQSN